MTNHDELLLTREEIIEIEDYALKHPILKQPNVLNIFGLGYKSIVKISPRHNLIFVIGNNDTGYVHITNRHEFWSNTQFWIDYVDESGQPSKRLQDPSKFRKESLPFLDYVKIADSIYSPFNLDLDSNNRPNEFELYIGSHTFSDGSTEKFRLLLYKGSKVVHTMFPLTDKNNRKRTKKFNFKSGKVSCKLLVDKSITEITVPYIDCDGKIRYAIQIIKFLDQNLEKCLILIYNDCAEPVRYVPIGKRQLPNTKSIEGELFQWQNSDLREFENHIKIYMTL
ncbi:MAG: hypothetical protein Q8N05_05075 [Bacteroidota bacterium]|nr:hypothetical protein [Bacteroidota bacterium]